MKDYIHFLFVACLFISCGSKSSTNENNDTSQDVEQGVVNEEVVEVREVSALTSFAAFLHDFCSDADFQMSRIKFPLGTMSGVIDNSGSELKRQEFTKEFWWYRSLESFIVDSDWEEGGFTIENDNKVTFCCQGLEIGYFFEYTFERIDGKWMLVKADESESGVLYSNDGKQKAKDINTEYLKTHPRVEGYTPYVPKAIEGDYPQASERLLTDDDVAGLSKKELRLMRNEIFARYGRYFKSEDLQKHFMSKRWYAPMFNNVDKFMTQIELDNVKFISAVENRK